MEASSQDEAFSFASAFCHSDVDFKRVRKNYDFGARWNLSACPSWRISLDRCEIVTGDAVYNHQYGYLNCQKTTTMSSSSIRKHAGTGAASDQPGFPSLRTPSERELWCT